MFEARKKKAGILFTAFQILGLIYVSTVRIARSQHGNALFAILISMSQALIFIGVFYLMFTFLGVGMAKIPGADFMLYLMTGIFLFLVHNKAVMSVMGAEGPQSPMMQHAPMNTAITISASALSCLYLQSLTIVVMLFVYHVGFAPVHFEEPLRVAAMLVVAWFSGCAVGLLLLGLKPWMPGFAGMLSQIYTRANMFTSGKMFVANSLPGWMIAMFDWNPLFHVIDQSRGFAFINYTPRHTSVSYPLYVSLALIVIGMLGEFYTRRYASLSWNARR